MACGGAHMCGTTFNGESVCWGSNDRGQLGAGITDPVSGQPLKINSPTPNTKYGYFSLGEKSSCGVAYNGDLYCWGDNSQKQLSSAVVNESTNLPTLYRGIYLEDEAAIPYVSEVALGDPNLLRDLCPVINQGLETLVNRIDFLAYLGQIRRACFIITARHAIPM